jgi:hypothetical protein
MGPQRQRRRGGDDGFAVVGVAVCVTLIVGAMTMVVGLIESLPSQPGSAAVAAVGAAALAAGSIGAVAALVTDRRDRRVLMTPRHTE